MTLKTALSIRKGISLSVLAVLTIFPANVIKAENIEDSNLKGTVVGRIQSLTFEERAKINYDTYILGPGDILDIELLDLPELSGRYSIGPDGTIYLPRLRSLSRGRPIN